MVPLDENQTIAIGFAYIDGEFAAPESTDEEIVQTKQGLINLV